MTNAESLIFSKMKNFCEVNRLDPAQVIPLHEVLLKSVSGQYILMQSFPAIEILDVVEQNLPVVIPEQESNEQQVTQESPFWISISVKTGFRRLHVRHGCGVQPWTCRRTEDVWTLKEVNAHATCKDCVRRKPDEFEDEQSTSGSSSSDPDEVVQNVVQVVRDMSEDDAFDQQVVSDRVDTNESWDLTNVS